MKKTMKAALLVLAVATAPAIVHAADQAGSWDGLVQVESKNFDVAYLAPGADFRSYTKIMVDAPEVAFQKNWLRQYNDDVTDLSQRISDDEAREMLAKVQSGFQEIFTQAYVEGGYQVVTTPAADVVRLRTGVLNISVTAPDTMSPGRSVTVSSDAGSATFIIEARDSMSGAILGRAVDKRDIGDSAFMISRSSASNQADFERVFKQWAKMSVEAMNNLRTMAPLPQ